MNTEQFKSELQMGDIRYDPWGTAMEAMFQCCAHLYMIGEVPGEWEYRQAPFTEDAREPDSYWYDSFNKCSYDELIAIGTLLKRYIRYLKFKGMDY